MELNRKIKTTVGESLIGINFGEAIVIKEFSQRKELKNNGRLWQLKCICGSLYKASTKSLNKGRKTHCGCKREKISEGKRYGFSTAIKPSDKIGYWIAECDCGSKFETKSYYLETGHTKSCGCLHKTGKQKTPSFQLYGRWFGALIRNAKERKIEFNISQEDIWNLFLKQNKKCALTGIELKFATCLKDEKEQTASIDRIDSKKGYTIDNIQIVYKIINIIKNNLSQEDFIKLCNLVTKIHPRK